ncbi:hypothetical protein JCM9534A_83090 [Catenuloplanes indicus JCM 9534]|uniref:Metallothionein n=1 Tax=Catenuloplanes indicus TaxID=137267 RepID=A0AAE3VTG5_9ACTN|nr:hypothetical protein [Catenuloplanes indicus]MDQ0371676.1 hypothetical protein [Catenuloplanes indicus]
MTDAFTAVVAQFQECPAGRLCSCQHPGGEYSCVHCRCDCPFPDPCTGVESPDACQCCGRDFFHRGER